MALLLIDYITYFNEYKDSIWIDYIQNQGTHTLTLISFFMLAKCAKHLNTLSTLTLNCKVSLALVIAINLYYIIGVDQSVYDPLEEFLYNGYHPDLNNYTIGFNTSISIIILGLSQLLYIKNWKVSYMLAEFAWIVPVASALSYLFSYDKLSGYMSITSTVLLLLLAGANITQFIRKPVLRGVALDKPTRKLVARQTLIYVIGVFIIGVALATLNIESMDIIVIYATVLIWGSIKLNVQFGNLYSRQRKSLINAYNKLNQIAVHDQLTGALTRRGLNDYIELHHEQTFALVLIDLDKFKVVNDTYGHNIGDVVLEEFSEIIRSTIRKTDAFVRWGGEEFMILMPESNLVDSLATAETIRLRIENETKANKEIPAVTASFGISIYNKRSSFDKAVKIADEALYDSKNNGRNTITVGNIE